jgi:malate permease and related proteins
MRLIYILEITMLHTLLTASESIVPIIVMIAVGFFMARKGWINETFGNASSKFLLNIALPCYMIWNLMDNFDRGKLLALVGGLLVPVITKVVTYFLSIPVSNLMKIPRSRKGVFRSIFFCSNTIFVGLPINLELFGTESVPYVLLYYIVNTLLFWTLGNYEISCDGEASLKAPLFSKATVKKVFSPALIGFLLGIVFILLQVKFPQPVTDSLRYLGNTTTPLALIFIGLTLTTIPLRQLKLDRELSVLILARSVLSPLLVAATLQFIPLPKLMGEVFIIQSAMPAMTNTSIVAKGYGADYKFASVATVVTTLACVIAIPIIMCFIH